MKNQKNPTPTPSKLSVLRQLCNLIPNHLVPKIARETGVDAKARSYLAAQREKFLDNEPVDRAEGYVRPDDADPPGAPS